jgi:hypothetical protein
VNANFSWGIMQSSVIWARQEYIQRWKVVRLEQLSAGVSAVFCAALVACVCGHLPLPHVPRTQLHLRQLHPLIPSALRPFSSCERHITSKFYRLLSPCPIEAKKKKKQFAANTRHGPPPLASIDISNHMYVPSLAIVSTSVLL